MSSLAPTNEKLEEVISSKGGNYSMAFGSEVEKLDF